MLSALSCGLRIGSRKLTIIPPETSIDIAPGVETDNDEGSARGEKKDDCYDGHIGLRGWIDKVGFDSVWRS